MRVPLRFQITEFDCGSVSLLNAISFLFEREEIPAELVKKIYTYTLDCYDECGNLGQGGTSKEATLYLSKWLSNYANSHDFNLKCTYLEKEEVTFDKIKEVVNMGGVAHLRTHEDQIEHYVIITKIDSKYVYMFDSYYVSEKKFKSSKMVKLITNKPFNYNRKVRIERFISNTKADFSMGDINNRECLLIERTNCRKK